MKNTKGISDLVCFGEGIGVASDYVSCVNGAFGWFGGRFGSPFGVSNLTSFATELFMSVPFDTSRSVSVK